MKVLAIGNSFSCDGTRYLYQIAKEAGEKDVKIINLHIGGCPLRLHYLNALEDAKAYGLDLNGEFTGFYVSIKDALISDEWDIVTIQQQSSRSTNYDTFQPYLDFMAGYIRKYAPTAKIYLQQTWAYTQEGCEGQGYENHAAMFADIKKSYEKAAKAIDADGIIPSGEVMNGLLVNGLDKIHRDPIHASLGVGRYALGLTWYAALTGKDIVNNTFAPGNTFLKDDETASEVEIAVAKKTVTEVMKEYR